jgi:hypothetical protein
MFLYALIYWLAEFGDVSCLQFNYLRVETLTPTWEDLVGHLSVWSPTKLSVRPECLIVDTLGGICIIMINNKLWTLDKQNIQYSYDFVVLCCVGPLALPKKDNIDPWRYRVRLPWLLKIISSLYKPPNNPLDHVAQQN